MHGPLVGGPDPVRFWQPISQTLFPEYYMISTRTCESFLLLKKRWRRFLSTITKSCGRYVFFSTINRPLQGSAGSGPNHHSERFCARFFFFLLIFFFFLGGRHRSYTDCFRSSRKEQKNEENRPEIRNRNSNQTTQVKAVEVLIRFNDALVDLGSFSPPHQAPHQFENWGNFSTCNTHSRILFSNVSEWV